MPPTLAVQAELLDEVRRFVEERGLPWEVSGRKRGTVRIAQAPEGERPQCDLDTLHAGGWIPCAMALGIALKLQVDPLKLGALLNLLDIKVRACSLGCFP